MSYKILENYLNKLQNEKLGFDNFPPGWDKSSVKKFAKSLTDETGESPKDKGWFDACVKKIEGELDDPEAFCASVLDTIKGDSYWRGQTHKKGE